MNRRGADRTGPLGGAMVGLWGASSLVESVQSGAISIGSAANTSTATITTVDTTRSFVLHNGNTSNNGAASPQASQMSVVLTNGTTVTAQRDSVGIADNSTRYTVIAFRPGIVKSIQTGTVELASVSTAVATITAVNTAKSAIFWNGTRVAAALDNLLTLVRITSSTQVTVDRYSAAATQSYGSFTVVEFF